MHWVVCLLWSNSWLVPPAQPALDVSPWEEEVTIHLVQGGWKGQGARWHISACPPPHELLCSSPARMLNDLGK